VGSNIYSSLKATDIDAGVNGAVEYFLVEGSHNLTEADGKVADGFGTFAIAYPHQGHVSYMLSCEFKSFD
jgi:protocadherin-15